MPKIYFFMASLENRLHWLYSFFVFSIKKFPVYFFLIKKVWKKIHGSKWKTVDRWQGLQVKFYSTIHEWPSGVFFQRKNCFRKKSCPIRKRIGHNEGKKNNWSDPYIPIFFYGSPLFFLKIGWFIYDVISWGGLDLEKKKKIGIHGLNETWKNFPRLFQKGS